VGLSPAIEHGVEEPPWPWSPKHQQIGIVSRPGQHMRRLALHRRTGNRNLHVVGAGDVDRLGRRSALRR
jgi:hypothetical protein